MAVLTRSLICKYGHFEGCWFVTENGERYHTNGYMQGEYYALLDISKNPAVIIRFFRCK